MSALEWISAFEKWWQQQYAETKNAQLYNNNNTIIILIKVQCACQKSLTKLLAPSTGQWRQCCDDVMKIELPSPRKPAIVTPKQGSLYHEMGECVQTPFYTFTEAGGEFEALDCLKIKPRATIEPYR